jgi:hypothetical protein
METNINLKQLEKKVYTSYHQDGLIEIFIGLVFLLYGIMMVTENTPFIALSWMPALLILPAKKMITIPRIGIVRFKSTRKIKITKAAIVLLITGTFTLIIVLFFITNSTIKAFSENFLVFIIGAVVSVPSLVGAILLNIKRYFIYAFLSFWMFGLEGFFQGSAPYNFLSFGIILLVVGTFVLFTFINKHPKPEKNC